jgi:hypothetical protein
MTDTDRTAERAAEIRARLDAISPTMSVRVVDGDNTLQATTARSERLGEFTEGVAGLVEALGDVKVRQTGVTIADDEEGQDLTFLLHAPKDIAYLLEQHDRDQRHLQMSRIAHKHATEQRDKYTRRVIEWREAAEKAAAERDAARSRTRDLEDQLAKARADVDGWTLTATARGVMVSHETDQRVLVADQGESLPLGAALAFIADPAEELIGPDTPCPCGKVNDGTGSGYCSGEHFEKYDGWNV